MRNGAAPRIVAVLLAVACTPQADQVPSARFVTRLEARLARARGELKPSLSHYQLVFPVEEADLLAFMQQVRVLPGADEPSDLVLGTDFGVEPHGGGLLELLLDDWRPTTRAVQLSDRFPFQGVESGLALSALYGALARQVFLPVPGRDPEQIAGAIPSGPELARIRLHAVGLPPTEVDAYHFLRLLALHEVDPSRTWRNRLGQRLSAALLLDHARRYYLASSDTTGEPSDHSRLHLVEVLLAASPRLGGDPDELKHHFLEVELRRVEFAPHDATLLLGHYAESLGLLLADPHTHFDPNETRQVRDWLHWLESSWYHDLDSVDPRHLAHLLRGLRMVRDHRDRLAER